MRPTLVQWLESQPLPGWIVPRYFTLAVLATFLASLWVLRLTRRDGARVEVAARALAATYVGAMAGGYVFEFLRMLPRALLTHNLGLALGAGRAAYGGLLFGMLGAVLVLRHAREPVGAFLDRAAPGTGLIFVLVRFGCFLEGCDYGKVTASALGVRFPMGSLAANDHLARGWIPAGAESLPVHPTELYECAVGALGAVVALLVRARKVREGAAFAAFLVVYAAGRASVEGLRGDLGRGLYLGVSTGQWTSLAIVASVLVWWWRGRSLPRVRMAAAVAAMVLAAVFGTHDAHAQTVDWRTAVGTPTTPAPQPTTTATPATTPAPATPTPVWNHPNRFAFRLLFAPTVSVGRETVPNGVTWELFAGARVSFTEGAALEFGLELRTFGNDVAQHNSVGLPLFFIRRFGTRFETVAGLVFQYTAIGFRAGFFDPANAFGMRIEAGGQFRLGSRFAIGGAPVSFTWSYGDTTGFIGTIEPRIWLGFAL